MRKWSCCLLILLSAGCSESELPTTSINASSTPAAREASEPSEPRAIHVDDLNKVPVIGKLGVPLGKCVILDATIISGWEISPKMWADHYALRIHAINEKPLPEPLDMIFKPFEQAEAKYPCDTTSLCQLRTGQTFPGFLPDEIFEQFLEWDTEYLGQRVQFVAFETGDFQGMREEAPGEPCFRAGCWFRFESRLIVLRDTQQSRFGF